MLRAIDPSSASFLTDLGRINQRAERAQRQIASGLRVVNPSDDPDNISPMLELRSQLEAARQAGINLGRVKAEVDTAEQALQTAEQILERAAVLASQGTSANQTPGARRMIATEAGSLLEQLVGISATMIEGRYIFGGDNDQTPPFDLDLNQTNGVSAYAGAASTRQTIRADGTRFAIAHSGDEIFDDPNGASAFGAINSLRTALESDDGTAIQAAIDNIRLASVHMNAQLAFYGSVQNRVQEASDDAAKRVTRLETDVGTIESADVTAAIVELNQARFQQEAALSSRAQMPQSSLFQYLR